MRQVPAYLVGLLFVVHSAGAAEPRGKIKETWDAAFLESGKAGYVHTTTKTLNQGGQTIVRTTVELDLTVTRFNDPINMHMETGTEETSSGQVMGVFMTQNLGKKQKLEIRGTVEDGHLHVLGNAGKRLDKVIPWNNKVVGLARQENLFREHKVMPGDEFSYLTYEPTIVAVITNHVVVQDYERVQSPLSGKSRRLLRAQAVADKIGGFQLPTLTMWLDEDLIPIQSQVDMPGLGKLTLVRTTQAEAQARGAVARITDVGYATLIPINERIFRPYDTKSAVYRITLKGDPNPRTAFAEDGRQTVKNVKGDTLELHIRANSAEPVKGPSKVKPEFLSSSLFINCDDPKVKEHARHAVGDETDALKKARLIESWVHVKMENKNFTEAFATSDEVARTLEGDCTEHAVLAAAMCRAVGVPSRTAIGLLYVDDARRGPVMGFHMWAEAFARGRWFPIDATLGRGYVGATHIKISDQSWHDVQSLTPLLPALRVLGKISIEVLRVNDDD